MHLTEQNDPKRVARTAAYRVRKAAADAAPGSARIASAYLLDVVAGLPGVRTIAGYLPIRSEIDPLPSMLALRGLGFDLAMPVVLADAAPLGFRTWSPRTPMAQGAYGILEPAEGVTVMPDALIVPMLGFDRCGHRLGYGGGYYDRTIAALRARAPLATIGLAYAAQELPRVPDVRGHDMALDVIVTECGVVRPC